MRVFSLLVLVVLSINEVSVAGPLMPGYVVSSSLEHYPEVKEAVLNLNVAGGEKSKARGGFDARITGLGDSRTSGPFDGDYAEVKIEKPLGFLSSTVYAGARTSDGNFPVYEGKYKTLSQGEMLFGVSVSLLRNNGIDERRLNLVTAKEGENQAKLLLNNQKIIVQTLALKTYWNWLTSGYQVKVYEELLALAKVRNGRLKRRIKAGDLARIYAIENEQYILKREAAYLKSLNSFRKNAFYLSLFNRSDDGKPLLPSLDQLPKIEEFSVLPFTLQQQFFTRAEKNNLKIQALSSKSVQAREGLRFAKNQLLPKLDFTYELSRDMGNGAPDLIGAENRFMVRFEIPIEYNKFRGQKRVAKAKLDQVRNQTSFLKEKVRVELNQISVDLKNSYDLYKLTQRQISLSDKMVKAESKKFRSGASDLILVNLREQHYAQAQIEHLSAFLNFKTVTADLKKVLVEFL